MAGDGLVETATGTAASTAVEATLALAFSACSALPLCSLTFLVWTLSCAKVALIVSTVQAFTPFASLASEEAAQGIALQTSYSLVAAELLQRMQRVRLFLPTSLCPASGRARRNSSTFGLLMLLASELLDAAELVGLSSSFPHLLLSHQLREPAGLL